MADAKKNETAGDDKKPAAGNENQTANKPADKPPEGKTGDDKKPAEKRPRFAFPVSCKGVGEHIVELEKRDPAAAQAGFLKYFGIIESKEEIKVGEPTEIEE
ncbi:hypothetical protein GYB59_02075 [bacterium]|nr:hypothetical protein [bacterium]